MSEEKWKELVDRGVAQIATNDYYQEVEGIILWGDAELTSLRSEIKAMQDFFGDVTVVSKERDILRSRVKELEEVDRLAKRASMIHNHASIFCTTCGVDIRALEELRNVYRRRAGKEEGE